MVCFFGADTIEMMVCLHHRLMMPVCLITSGVNLDHLFKMVYAGFLHCKVSIFLFMTDKYLGGDTLMLKPCFLKSWFLSRI